MLWIILGIVGGVVVVALVIFLIMYILKRGATGAAKVIDNISNNALCAALGGKENIKTIGYKGSRLILNLVDNALVKKKELHDLGIVSVIVGEDKVTLVCKGEAKDLANLLQK